MSNMPFIPCLTCAKSFKTIEYLQQHQKATYHYVSVNEETLSKQKMWTIYLNAYYNEKAMVLRDDRRKSRKIVQREIKKIRKEFDDDGDDDDFFSFKIEPAGSTATQTKVKTPDEYDFNLVINPDDISIRDTAAINFVVDGDDDDGDHLEESWDFYKCKGHKPPNGYVTVRYTEASEYQNEELTYRGFIIPRKVQEHLYRKINESLADDDYVSVSSVSHGPAIKFCIHPQKKYDIKNLKEYIPHVIDVDFAVAIKINEFDEDGTPAVKKYGWPRMKTTQCLSPNTINRILDAGVYLVPKDNLFWYISFSNAAKILLRSLDSPDTCRRKCHQILKADFLKWHSEERYSGISTYIFKNHLFWFNEELNVKDREKYWGQSNLGKCYMDLLRNLVKRLRSGILPNYFNKEENILENKDTDTLLQLADRINIRIAEMERIEIY